MINFDFVIELVREAFRQEERLSLERLGPGLYTCRDSYLWHLPEALPEIEPEAEAETFNLSEYSEAELAYKRGDFAGPSEAEAARQKALDIGEAEAEAEIYRGDFKGIPSEALADIIDAERQRRKYAK